MSIYFCAFRGRSNPWRFFKKPPSYKAITTHIGCNIYVHIIIYSVQLLRVYDGTFSPVAVARVSNALRAKVSRTTLKYSSFHRPYYNIIYYMYRCIVCDKIAQNRRKCPKYYAHQSRLSHKTCSYCTQQISRSLALYAEHNKVMSGRLTDTRCRAVSILRLNRTGDMCATTSSVETSEFFYQQTITHGMGI